MTGATTSDPTVSDSTARGATTRGGFETVTGYCWPQSVTPGERVALHLSSARSLDVTIEVARVGVARDVVHAEAGIPARDHPTPPDAPERGCDWPAS